MLGRQHPILLCSECGLVETDSTSIVAVAECPKCGSKSLNRESRQDSPITPPRPRPPRPKFQTASRLRLDVENNSLTIDIGEHVCLIGKRSKTIIERLCINALLPERHGGFGSPRVIIIDAGNSSDIYSCVNLARQCGLDIKDTLKRIVVSRAFTIYQLVNLVAQELPNVVRRFDTKLVIVSDMLCMLDSEFRIGEARTLIRYITNSLRRLSDISVIVSLNHVPPEYYQMLFPYFKCIEINDGNKYYVRSKFANHSLL